MMSSVTLPSRESGRRLRLLRRRTAACSLEEGQPPPWPSSVPGAMAQRRARSHREEENGKPEAGNGKPVDQLSFGLPVLHCRSPFPVLHFRLEGWGRSAELAQLNLNTQ